MSAIASPFQRYRHIRHFSIFQLAFLILASGLPIILSISPTFAHSPSSQPVPHSPIQNVIPFRSVCHYAGVSKDSNGAYHFSWLHVDSSTGYIMDAHNCIVDLHGFNSAGTEFADGVSPFPGLNSQRLTWFNTMFKMNYIRLNLNVGWWNSDVYVPNAQMHYRAWIQQWISWAEQNGDYVLLNRTNEYQLPPCGGTITYCPAQGELSDLDDAYPQQQFNAGHLLDQTLAFWNSIVSLYKNDPAILYNDWNELHDINAATWLQVHTTLIATIRAINPRSLIVLGSNDWNNTMSPIINGQVPDLNYPNLVYDWHIYDGKSGLLEGIPCTQGTSYMWAHWGAESMREFASAQQHGHGAMINEWGGCLDDPQYNTALSTFAASHHIGMAYYMAGNVVNNAWTAINANGILAQAAYARFSH
jgi:Cellulase (glycosyl hydrolase family 5)